MYYVHVYYLRNQPKTVEGVIRGQNQNVVTQQSNNF